VWPDPANNLSRVCRVESQRQLLSLRFVEISTSQIHGRYADGFSAMRDQGTSMDAGFGMVMIPTAPASRKAFQRSPAV